MAVRNIFSPAYNQLDPTETRKVVDTRFAAGQFRGANGRVDHLDSDLAGSIIHMVRVPSHAVIRHESRLDLQNLGVPTVEIGVVGAQTGFLNIADVSALSAVSTPVTLFGSKWGKELWEAVGLSEDPTGWLDLAAFITGDATAVGYLTYDWVWQVD